MVSCAGGLSPVLYNNDVVEIIQREVLRERHEEVFFRSYVSRCSYED